MVKIILTNVLFMNQLDVTSIVSSYAKNVGRELLVSETRLEDILVI